MKLSIIMPVYNERETILEILKRVKALQINKEILIVDDFSKDGTRELLEKVDHGDEVRVICHDRNQGKGGAIRTALQYASGDAVIIQDADLEVNPQEIPKILKPIKEGKAQVVFGTRFRSDNYFSRTTFFANRFLTGLTNFLYNIHITDMETCYKCIETGLMKSIGLKARGFDFEPEVTAKIAKRGYRIIEVPISYRMRSTSEGKKINWRDGVQAIFYLIKYRFQE
jgi:glycosyltransferase involved in cell wall biosynthesis